MATDRENRATIIDVYPDRDWEIRRSVPTAPSYACATFAEVLRAELDDNGEFRRGAASSRAIDAAEMKFLAACEEE